MQKLQQVEQDCFLGDNDTRADTIVTLRRIWSWFDPRSISDNSQAAYWYSWLSDVVAKPQFRAALRRSKMGRGSSECFALAPMIFRKVVADAEAKLLQELCPPKRQLRGGGEAFVWGLARASVFCTFCTSVVRFPRLLSHRCRKDFTLGFRESDDALQRLVKISFGVPWDITVFDFKNSLARMDWLLRACGRDPDTQQYAEILHMAVTVTYTECSTGRTIVVGPMPYHAVVSLCCNALA